MSDIGDTHEFRHVFTSKLVGTQEEEESVETPPTLASKSTLANKPTIGTSDNTLAILKQTEEVLKSLSGRMQPENVRSTVSSLCRLKLTVS